MCDSVTCDFEADHLCAWDLAEGPNRWKLGTGSVGTEPYGISGAEPSQGVGYVYVDSSVLPYPHEPAEIDTHYQPPVRSQLSFYYRAYGFGVVSFQLFLQQDETRYLLWSVHSDRREWQRAEVEICSEITYKVRHSIRSKSFMEFRYNVFLDFSWSLKRGSSTRGSWWVWMGYGWTANRSSQRQPRRPIVSYLNLTPPWYRRPNQQLKGLLYHLPLPLRSLCVSDTILQSQSSEF